MLYNDYTENKSNELIQQATNQLREDKNNSVVTEIITELAKYGTRELTTFLGLQLKSMTKAFIAQNPYTSDYYNIILPIFDLLTTGTGCNLHDKTSHYIFANYPIADFKARFSQQVKSRVQENTGFL